MTDEAVEEDVYIVHWEPEVADTYRVEFNQEVQFTERGYLTIAVPFPAGKFRVKVIAETDDRPDVFDE